MQNILDLVHRENTVRKMPFGACVRGGKSHIYFGVKAPQRGFGDSTICQ